MFAEPARALTAGGAMQVYIISSGEANHGQY